MLPRPGCSPAVGLRNRAPRQQHNQGATHKLGKCVDEPAHTCPLPGPASFLQRRNRLASLRKYVRSPSLLELVIIGASFGYVEADALCASSERRRRQALRRTPAAIDL